MPSPCTYGFSPGSLVSHRLTETCKARGFGESIQRSRSKGGSACFSCFLSLTLFKDSSLHLVQVNATMLVVLIGTVILHLLDLILLVISTSVNAWSKFQARTFNLWYDCITKNGGYHCTDASNSDWLQAVQGLMILATIFCLLSLILFIWQLFTLNKGGRFFFTAVFQILSSLFVMSGAIIYTVMGPGGQDEDYSFGFAFVLAWLAFPLTLISGLIYIVLRKKE
ncbi:hypothetical protein PDJAM_G00045690 [Pangasius djambal]|uniref:Uncharacterized protein n=1 Tax=Pangasius djambal TaxID=1691987 RepID=A0ACC5YW98_9TELE|nr:hypothetical protein [Pangasius djambal]